MIEPRVELQADEAYEEAVSRDGLQETLLRVAETALDREHVSGPDRVTLVITGDDTLRRLNRDFMGYDEVTDVLSFNATDGASRGVVPDAQPDWAAGIPDQDGEAGHLGDIVISYPQAARQAEESGHSVARELAVLTAHGVLHLLGYDHAEPEEHREMFSKMDAILEEALASPGSRQSSNGVNPDHSHGEG